MSARFEVCRRCRLHGRVVCADGSVSEDVDDEAHAKDVVRRFFQEGKFSDDDLIKVVIEIKEFVKCVEWLRRHISMGFEVPEGECWRPEPVGTIN